MTFFYVGWRPLRGHTLTWTWVRVGAFVWTLALTLSSTGWSGDYGPQTEAVSLEDYSQVIHVAADSSAGAKADGTKSAPFPIVAKALSKATPTSRKRVAILVAKGTYAGETIQMKEGVDLFGGYSPEDWTRDIEANETVLDGEGKQRVLIGANDSRIDGFTIARGRTDGFGGGLLCESASPEITNNVFENNGTIRPADFNAENTMHQEGNGGGAIALIGSSPIVRGNTFSKNKTEVGNGGGILCLSLSSPRIEGNLFVGNVIGEKDEDTRSSNGGAIGCSHSSSPRIVGNVLLENHAGGRGDAGGIYLEYHCSPHIEKNLLTRNTSDDDGAAIYVMKGSRPTLSFNTIVGNAQGGKGGSTVRLSKVGSAVLNGNRIIGNQSTGFVAVDSWADTSNNLFAFNKGGAIADSRGELVCTNDTICDQPENGVSIEQGSVYLTNAIVSGNGKTGVNVQSGNIVFFNCLIEGGVFQHEEAGGEIEVNGEIPGSLRGRENFDADAKFEPDSWEGTAKSISYDAGRFMTALELDGSNAPAERAVGGALRVGESWGIVSKVNNNQVSLWGDFTEEVDASDGAIPLFVPSSYRLTAGSPCVNKGKNLGAPLYDFDSEARPVHRITQGSVDVGADEFLAE